MIFRSRLSEKSKRTLGGNKGIPRRQCYATGLVGSEEKELSRGGSRRQKPVFDKLR